MKGLVLAFSFVLSLAVREIQIRPACSGSICLENLVWKKGAAAHTLTGTISTKVPIESVQLHLDFTDGQRSGNVVLNLRSIWPTQPFFFKVNAGGLLGWRFRPS